MKKKLSKLAAALMIAGFMFAGVPQAKAGDYHSRPCIITCAGTLCSEKFQDINVAIDWIDHIEDNLCP